MCLFIVFILVFELVFFWGGGGGGGEFWFVGFVICVCMLLKYNVQCDCNSVSECLFLKPLLKSIIL